ncbi:MAG: TetR/AcrR family transcriptional regulator [Chloroflexota bacterium]|nr:MAG: TetR/AcrR family transcriptional regulator [Chloroflexota bacterium]
MPRVTAAHEQEVRERIAGAALRVFGDRGFHGATIADVVRESGLSVGAIYTHFRGKEDLFLAACDLASGRGLGELAARLAAGTSVAEKLAIAVGFYFDTAEETAVGPGNAEFLVQAWAQADAEPAAREMLLRRREQLVMAGTFLLEEGMARGDLARWMDAGAVARAYVALLDGMLLARAEQGDAFRRSEAERAAREILTLVVAAAAVPDRPSVPAIPPNPYSIVGLEAADSRRARAGS